ncbi:hypothetical protein BGZ96_010412 [Linnemannia gamsii]|uniref:Uncharacterized protein n=1 Tax=Linnemannia gamsii TaxID=64522 RepID=A0ABQ7KD86_9FUNG|nr:hypothetical protein BGZ96_010412 [Linnemannia gamsii]
MIFNVASIASAMAIVSLSVVSAAPSSSGQTVQITSSSDWCMMMPPQAGGDIAASEDHAIAFCTSPSSTTPGAKTFPEGFIQSANFASGNGYVQITGKIDSSKYSLSATDRGGQYDIKGPSGSACAGYNHYVNLIEPHSNTMCIRCCKEKKDCNTGKSTYGCAAVIPGDYSGSSPSASGSVQPTGTATNSGTDSPSGTATGPATGPATGSATVTGTAPGSIETGSLTIDPIFPPTGTASTATIPATTITPTVTAPVVSPSTAPNAAVSGKSQSVGVMAAVAALGAVAVFVL